MAFNQSLYMKMRGNGFDHGQAKYLANITELPWSSGGGGGGAQVDRYEFDYTLDDATMANQPGVTLTTTPLAEGTFIENCWISVRDHVLLDANTSNRKMYVNLVSADDPGVYERILKYTLNSQADADDPVGLIPITVPDTLNLPCTVMGSDCHVAVAFECAEPFTDGLFTLSVQWSEPT
jgi:hypothetical protein